MLIFNLMLAIPFIVSLPIQLSTYPLVIVYPPEAWDISTAELVQFREEYRERLDGSPSSAYSSSIYLTHSEDRQHPLLMKLVQVLTTLADAEVKSAEPFSLSRYFPGQQYAWHVDNYDKRQLRKTTFLIYLSDISLGGETIFQYLSPNLVCPRLTSFAAACASSSAFLKIKPQLGKILQFENLNSLGNIQEHSRHGSCPVRSSEEKWILQLWIRDDFPK